MNVTEAKLTPVSDTEPTKHFIREKDELSGKHWCSRFPRSKSINDLTPSFSIKVKSFIDALKKAGATVNISNTFRPPEACYLMHYSFKLSKKQIKAKDIPKFQGGTINIKWDHGDENVSVQAAKDMVNGYGTGHLRVSPALNSLHTSKEAIDMNIMWSDNLVIENAHGESIEIKTLPKTGMNKTLHEVGKTYGIIKFRGGDADKPHWSTTGY